ncbi:MAG TPA: hypothetical protein PLA74_04250 [Syntrophales bacterium]|nr:hypothetical protein [Syntrophales bacterium]HPQ43659.1 hypothetical protein [Syntrophales bacterium]
MTYYLLLPFFSLLVLTIQVTVFDILFFGKAGLEISLILVVYAGLYLNIVRGGILSFVIGFFLDCITGVMPGFFVLNYMLIFFISKAVSLKVYAGGMIFAIGFTFLCALLGKLLIVLMYEFLYGINVFYDIVSVSFFQALVTCVSAPAFFVLFYHIEGLLNVWEARSSD